MSFDTTMEADKKNFMERMRIRKALEETVTIINKMEGGKKQTQAAKTAEKRYPDDILLIAAKMSTENLEGTFQALKFRWSSLTLTRIWREPRSS